MSSNEKGVRLNQFLARAGVASRRHAEELIATGRVSVNGETAETLGVRVDPSRDRVEVDGERVRQPKHLSYYAFYKPKKVVSTMEDPEGRDAVKDYLPRGVRGLFPVGRLDYHSEGLMLLTNDGELASRLMHPRFKVAKTYEVKVKGYPSLENLDKLKKGIYLDGKRTLPVEIKKIQRRETSHTWLEIRMTEGRKNQLREMFFRIEHPVIKLKRVAFGAVKLGKMKPGEFRELTREETEELAAGSGQRDIRG